jgi:hypothetical protein
VIDVRSRDEREGRMMGRDPRDRSDGLGRGGLLDCIS